MSIADAKCSKSPGNHDMLEDVMLEILLRLPVKSLVRFKCVCKQWYAIIESKIFVEQHFCHNQERLLVLNYKSYENRHAYALFLDDICSGFEEPAHLQLPNMLNEVLGPVNGVFCLVGRWRDLALLNPATRQLKPLPKLPEDEPYFSLHENVLGFGLDALSGDYKVVSIWYFYDLEMDSPDCNTMVFVYNLGSDSWRILEDVGCFKTSSRACISPCKTFFNGVYYWAMTLFDNTVAAVLAFDMTTEKFQEIQVPDCCKSKSGYLTMHGDSIALVSYGNDCCEVWVMEKEGSWNRGAVLGPYPANSLPLCLWKNDLFLREGNTSCLTLYNVCTKKRQVTRVRVTPNADILSVFSYKESLVSIKGNVDNCMLWDASRDILAIAWEYNDVRTSAYA